MSIPGEQQREFAALVSHFATPLYRYAYWLSGDRACAQDLVQETFLRAWRRFDSLRDEKAAQGWLMTILRREHARGFAQPRLNLVEEDPEAAAIQLDALRPEIMAMRKAVLQLPQRYREPLVLQVLEGYSLQEIAARLNLPANTVATRLFRARARLRRMLSGEKAPLRCEVRR